MVGIMEKLLNAKIHSFRYSMYKIITVFIICAVICLLLAIIMLYFSFIHSLIIFGVSGVLWLCVVILIRYIKTNVKRFKQAFNPLNVSYIAYCKHCQPTVSYKENSHILPESPLTCETCGGYLTIVREGDHRLFEDGDEGFSLI